MNTSSYVGSLSLGDAALLYANRFGFAVFPLYPKSKSPLTKNGFKNATTNSEQIKRWWKEFPKANIGIATGMISKIAVVDVDPKPDAEKIRKNLEEGYEPLSESFKVISGSNGMHFYFKICQAMKTAHGRRGGLPVGVDFQADGAYIVAPPSVHPNGKLYAFDRNANIFFEEIPPLPSWILHKIQNDQTSRISEVSVKVETDKLSLPSIALHGAPNGERNVSAAALVGHLLRRYVDPDVASALLTHWNRTANNPPLEEQELAKIVNSIAGRELSRRLGGYNG